MNTVGDDLLFVVNIEPLHFMELYEYVYIEPNLMLQGIINADYFDHGEFLESICVEPPYEGDSIHDSWMIISEWMAEHRTDLDKCFSFLNNPKMELYTVDSVIIKGQSCCITLTLE